MLAKTRRRIHTANEIIQNRRETSTKGVLMVREEWISIPRDTIVCALARMINPRVYPIDMGKSACRFAIEVPAFTTSGKIFGGNVGISIFL